jgi:hypothetical protein
VLVQFGQRNQGGSLDVIEHIIINDLGDEWVMNTKLSRYQKGKSPCWLTLELTYINDNKLVCLLCLDSSSFVNGLGFLLKV